MIPVQPLAVTDFAVPFAAPIHPCAQAYHDRLHPWLIIRRLPNMQRSSVCRFRRHSEAEEYLKVLQRLTPNATYQIIFDPPEPPLPESTTKI
jgi:hypothetical protein